MEITMKNMICILTTSLISLSCTLGAQTDTTAPTRNQIYEYNKIANPEYVCEDPETGKQLECKYDEDCCEGFVCVPDRSVSRSTKFCEHNGE